MSSDQFPNPSKRSLRKFHGIKQFPCNLVLRREMKNPVVEFSALCHQMAVVDDGIKYCCPGLQTGISMGKVSRTCDFGVSAASLKSCYSSTSQLCCQPPYGQGYVRCSLVFPGLFSDKNFSFMHGIKNCELLIFCANFSIWTMDYIN